MRRVSSTKHQYSPDSLIPHHSHFPSPVIEAGLQAVRSVMGDDFASQTQIADALRVANYDANGAIDALLAQRAGASLTSASAAPPAAARPAAAAPIVRPAAAGSHGECRWQPQWILWSRICALWNRTVREEERYASVGVCGNNGSSSSSGSGPHRGPVVQRRLVACSVPEKKTGPPSLAVLGGGSQSSDGASASARSLASLLGGGGGNANHPPPASTPSLASLIGGGGGAASLPPASAPSLAALIGGGGSSGSNPATALRSQPSVGQQAATTAPSLAALLGQNKPATPAAPPAAAPSLAALAAASSTSTSSPAPAPTFSATPLAALLGHNAAKAAPTTARAPPASSLADLLAAAQKPQPAKQPATTTSSAKNARASPLDDVSSALGAALPQLELPQPQALLFARVLTRPQLPPCWTLGKEDGPVPQPESGPVGDGASQAHALLAKGGWQLNPHWPAAAIDTTMPVFDFSTPSPDDVVFRAQADGRHRAGATAAAADAMP